MGDPPSAKRVLLKSLSMIGVIVVMGLTHVTYIKKPIPIYLYNKYIQISIFPLYLHQ